jgi:hypothetical protein
MHIRNDIKMIYSTDLLLGHFRAVPSRVRPKIRVVSLGVKTVTEILDRPSSVSEKYKKQ